jgi:hypothetical protein
MRSEQLVSLGIALPIPGQFPFPECGVCLGHRAVLGTAVPKAAININSDLCRPEDQIAARADTRDRSFVNPES